MAGSDPLDRWSVEQNLEAERLPGFRIGHLVVLQLVSRLLEQGDRLPKIGPQLLRIATNRVS